jgi:putative transposase
VTGMLANHRLARAISDAGWAEFARLIKYKQAWRRGELVEADRWYPSTRLCPACGATNGDMTLADRQFNCRCGHSADRDTNAAEGDPFGGPVAMRLSVGGSRSTVGRTRLG